jgi:hypothetical protein
MRSEMAQVPAEILLDFRFFDEGLLLSVVAVQKLER